MLITLNRFGGEIPRIQPRLLPDNMAQLAFNCRLDDGALASMRDSWPVMSVDPATQTIYKHLESWLAWNSLVHVAPGPVAQDRLYFTGDGVPKMQVAGNTYPLAIPTPSTAPGATLGGTATSETITARIYVFTWVSSFGEESAPSPASAVVNWKPGQTVTVSGFPAIPAGRAITKMRLYRSISSSNVAHLYLVAERDAATGNWSDAVPDSQLGEALPSLNWTPPVSTLQGMVALPNGIMAAFDGRELYFSEPWIPHAWPSIYKLTVDAQIVGLAATESALVVMTSGKPYLVQGTAPDSMSMMQLDVNLPCISAKSIVDLGYAVVYASYDGLVSVAGGSAKLVTQGLIQREAWLRYTPSSFVAAQADGRYILSYSRLLGDNSTELGCLLLDLTGEQPFLRRSNITAQAFHYNLAGGRLYYANEGSLFEFDSELSPKLTLNWRSKPFVTAGVNFAAIRIDATRYETAQQSLEQAQDDAGIIASNAAAFSGSLGGSLGSGSLNLRTVNGDAMIRKITQQKTLSVRVIADGNTVAVISEYNKPMRLPAGFLARTWEIEVSGNIDIAEIRMATTIKELGT